MTELNQIIKNIDNLKKTNFGLQNRVKSNDVIFHYTNIQSLYSIINDGFFQASNAMFLNDKSEVLHLKNIVKTVSDKIVKENNIERSAEFIDFVITCFEKGVEQISEITFIASFSRNPDSLPLWSSYSNQDGYCIGFDYNKLIEYCDLLNSKQSSATLITNKNNKEGHSIVCLYGDVIYDNEKKEDSTRNYLEQLLNIFNYVTKYFSNKDFDPKITSLIIESGIDFALMAYFTKDICFRDENEFRILFVLHETNTNNYIKYKTSHGLIVPYIEIKIRYYDDKLPLNEIIIGPKNNIDIAKEGINLYLKNIGYENVIIKKSHIPLRY